MYHNKRELSLEAKAQGYTEVQRYIKSIEDNDLALEEIQLVGLELDSTTIKFLIDALRINPEVARRITALNLQGNRITNINLQGLDLRALTWLALSNNQLTSINLQDLELGSLMALDLDHNQLTSINLQGLDLRELTRLSLQNNQLISINLQGLDLSLLTLLALNNNQLTSINLQGLDLKSLTLLALSDNQLTSIKLQGLGLVALTELFLNENQLTSINLQGLVALTELWLQYNMLTSIHNLQDLVALAKLYLNDNQLASINLQGLPLEQLELDFNQLRSINLQGQDLRALTSLSLSYNKLTNINNLQDLVALTRLDLDHNPLTTIAKIKINNFAKNNVKLKLLVDFNMGEFTSDRITNETLKAHSQVLLANLQDNNNKRQPMPSILMRGTGLLNDLTSMVFDFLNEDQKETNTLKELFPRQAGIINQFAANIKAVYRGSLSQLENEAGTDTKRIKTLLNRYRILRDTPTAAFQSLRDFTPADPTRNPLQITVWRPRA